MPPCRGTGIASFNSARSAITVLQASLEGVEIVLVDDSCNNESISSLTVAVDKAHVVWQQASQVLIDTDGLSKCTCIQKSGQLQTTVRCMYFDSQLDVEDFFISVHHENSGHVMPWSIWSRLFHITHRDKGL